MQQFRPKSDHDVVLPSDIAGIDAPQKLLELLYERGWRTRAEIERYLCPVKTDLHDPFLMQDMDKAVAVILDAMERKQKITVFGDYDVDGVSATAIMMTWLRKQGASVDYYIPDRHGEGYGLNIPAIEQIAARSQLLITVDCGITSVKEVARARELGMRVIVTDHHQMGEQIPECEAVLDPLLGDYPFRRLCGAGVAFKLLYALGGENAIEGLWDLAALATVADIVPLVDENRIIVSNGLKAMAEPKRPGIVALLEVANVTDVLTSTDIAFKLAPRINAGGRLALASRSVELLMTRNLERARQIAGELDGYNDKRKELEMRIFSEALEFVETNIDFIENRILIVSGEGWEQGVVGLVASRLVERYHWPAIVFSIGTDGTCVGSARSIPGIDIHKVLTAASDLFIRFGGHAQAAGLTVRQEMLPAIQKRLDEIIRESVDPRIYLPVQEYDLEVKPVELTNDFVEAFEVMQPVGFGNTAPVFYLSGLEISDARGLGKDNFHLRMTIGDENRKLLAIWFRKGHLLGSLPQNADLIASLYINEWRGQRSVQCDVSAMKASVPQKHFQTLCMQQESEIDTWLLSGMARADSAADTAEYLDEKELFSRYNPVLQSEIQGTLIVFHTPQGLRQNAVPLAQLLMNVETDFAISACEDSRGFNTVIMAPDFTQIRARYRRVILMDGVFWAGETAEIRRALGNCEIAVHSHTAPGIQSSPLDRFLDSISSTREELGDLFRIFRRESLSKPGLKALAKSCGREEKVVLAALIVFSQIGLIRLTIDPFGYELIPGKEKKQLETSSLYNLFLTRGTAK